LIARAGARPGVTAVIGAAVIAFSAILVELSHAAPSTAAIFRCAYALPVLGVLAWREDRRFGPRPKRDRWLALPAGLLFAIDLIAWHHAIADVGAGLATVLGNLQVVVVPLLAWALLRERVPPRMLLALPLVCVGILLISGALEHGAYGADPARGVLFGLLTGLSYGGFILVLRHGSQDLRRPAGPLFDTTAVATLAALAGGAALGEDHLVPTWPGHGWLVLLALSSQVLGWLLITVSLPRLPAALTSMTLTIQPIGSLILGAIILGEQPSALQLAGGAGILAGLVATATAARSASRRPALARTAAGRAGG
jgi:drug/metabolite transporter (DMT)-like permease